MSRPRIAALLLIIGLLPADTLQAQTGTWTGAGGAAWDTTATNWSGVTGTPWDATNGLTGIATFDGANTPSVSGTVYVNQINKSATAGNTTISNGTIILAGSNPTITNNSTSALNIGSILSGANGVTVTLGAGAGTAGGVTFSGNNTYSGTTTINGSNNGPTVTNNGALGTSSVLVNANGILKVSTGALSNAITINGGANNGAIQTFTSSTLSGLITVASNAIIGNRSAGSTLNLTGGIAASGQTLTLGGVGGSSSTIISANVVNLGSGGTFRAAAQPVTVNIGGNTWGTTQVDFGGVINLGATDALATASILQMGLAGGGETATVDLNGFSQTVAGLRSFTGSGSTSATGTRIVRNTGSAATLTVNNTTAYTYDGQINGAIALSKSGAGTLTLSGSSSYSGVTTISAGVLGITDANALGATGTSNGTTINSGAALQLSNNITIGETISLNSTGISNTGGISNLSGSNTVSGAIASGSAAGGGSRIGVDGGALTLTGGLTSGGQDVSFGARASNTSLIVTNNAINLGSGNFNVFGTAGLTNNRVILGVAGNTFNGVNVTFGVTLQTDVANAWNSNATLTIGGGEGTARPNTLNLNGNSQTVARLTSGNDGVVTNTITSASAATLTVSGIASGTYAGQITGAVALTKGGASALTLAGSNSYTGATTVSGSGSVLAISNANALGATSGITTVGDRAELRLSGGIGVAEPITLNGFGAVRGSLASLTNTSGTNTVSGLITLGTEASENWIRSDAGTLNLTGGVSSPNRQLTLTGAGGLNVTTNAINLGTGDLVAFSQTGSSPVSIGVAGNAMANMTIWYGGRVRTDVANAFSSSVVLNMGSGDNSNGSLDLNGNSQTFGNLQSSGNGTVVITSASAATLSVNQTASRTYAGTITGAVALTKSGTGTLTLTASNSYTGATTVSGSGSVLAISNANALGATSGITTVGDRAELRLSGGISVAEPITLNGFGAVRGSLAALTNTSGTNTVSGLITLGTEASENWIRSDAGTLNLAGGVTSPNRSLSLIGAGGLNVTTNAINLGTGDLAVFDQTDSSPVSIGVAGNAMANMTIWYGGRVRTDVANAFSSSVGLNMGSGDNSNGTLDLNGNSQTFGNLQSFGNGTVVVTSASAATLSVNQTASRTYAGQITGAVALTKGGASTLTLSGSNTYSGATNVNAGTLAVNGSIASAVNVANAAILGGAGTISGLVTVAGGGILAPGNSPGTLTMTSGLSLADSSILNFELNATDTTVGGGINDLIVVTGNFLFNGVLNVAGTGDFSTVADNTKWRLFNYSGGTFTDGVLTLGTMPSVGASGKYFQIDTATAGQVNLVIVPEPGAIALAGVGIAAAAWALRRRTA